MRWELGDDEIDNLRSEVSRQRKKAADNPDDTSNLDEMEYADAVFMVLSKMGKTPKEIIDVANAGKNDYQSPDVWLYKRKHPELLYWFNESMRWEDVAP